MVVSRLAEQAHVETADSAVPPSAVEGEASGCVLHGRRRRPQGENAGR